MKPPDLVPEGFVSTHRRGTGEISRFCIKCSENMIQFGSGDLILEVTAFQLDPLPTFDVVLVPHV